MSLILSGTDGLSNIDGSAATPAIRGADANTGIFFPAADTIAFSEGGVEYMRIDSSGNLSIGTTTSSGKFTILDNSGGAGVALITVLTNGVDANCYLSLTGSSATDKRIVIGPSTGTALAFQTNATERMRINAGAPILCLAGGSTTATGTGIAFPATQSASTDANTLDDYEEGTWTPTVTSSSGSITTVVVGGQYRKVGGLVSLQFNYQITNNGTGSGIVYVSNLPFTNTIGANTSAGIMKEIAVNGYSGVAYFIAGTQLFCTTYVSGYPGGTNQYWLGSICYYA